MPHLGEFTKKTHADLSAEADLHTPKDHGALHQNGGDQEISVAGLSGLLADQQTPLSHSTDKHGSAVLDTVVKMVAQAFSRIKTGLMTGDGSTDQGITGIGFQPKFGLIFPIVTSEGNIEIFLFFEKFTTGYALRMWSESGGSTSNFRMLDNRVITIDSDGFSVSDDGSDQNPNKANQSYGYVVFG